jgi:hypothetical protein
VHEPWEDREAEEFALSMSGKLCAPRALYDSIRADLAHIRATWGDSLPFLRGNEYVISARFNAWVWPDLETLLEMRAGHYRDWDSLNELLSVTIGDFTWSLPGIASSLRVNGWRLVELYERLPGIRGVEASRLYFLGGNVPGLCGFETREGRHYFFGKWPVCTDWCSPNEFFYFTANAAGVSYVGSHNVKDPEPAWWPLAKKAIQIFQLGDDQYRYRDKVPPGRVTDLAIVGNQVGDSVDITFTVPGDNGGEREPGGFAIRHATQPITEENWAPGNHPALDVWAGRIGEQARQRVHGLNLKGINYIAIRIGDAAGNWSRISNVVTCQLPK